MVPSVLRLMVVVVVVDVVLAARECHSCELECVGAREKYRGKAYIRTSGRSSQSSPNESGVLSEARDHGSNSRLVEFHIVLLLLLLSRTVPDPVEKRASAEEEECGVAF